MAVLGTEALTLADYRKRINQDGNVADIIEALEGVNPIIDDAVWIEGNLKTGNRTTIRATLPTPSERLINHGIKNSKSTTRQVDDTCIILEDRSEIDVQLIELAKDKQAFRHSEDRAYVQGFANAVAKNMFYGDTESNPFQFNGFSARYNICGGDKNTAGYQTISAGSPGSNTNTSIYIVGWGQRNTVGIYPQGSNAGLSQRDLGEQDATDNEGGKYRVLSTLFTWKCGLSVQDIRSNALLRNIDVSKLGSLTSAQSLEFMKKLTQAKNTIRQLDNKKIKYCMYVSDTVYNFMENYQLDKNNIHVTVREFMDQPPIMYFRGIPVKKCDAISEKEAEVTTA